MFSKEEKVVINHNLSAINSSRVLNDRVSEVQAASEKLASGMRINRAGDDASGLAVSEKMRSQIRGLNQADRNIQDGTSFVQTTEGYLGETQDVLQRLRELAVQSANGIYTASDRAQIQVETSQLVDEIDRVASHAQFNGMSLLKGDLAKDKTPLKIQVGANTDQSISITVNDMSSAGLGLRSADPAQGDTRLSLDTPEKANQALGVLDKALATVSKQRADLGGYQNRLEFAQKGVAIASENLQASESRIRDTDMAKEAVALTRSQILTQSATAMLAQANQSSGSVLKLL